MQLSKLLRPVLVALALIPAATDAAPRLPNIVIVLGEGIGFSDPACFGGEAATPTLDRLAANGLRFTQAYHAGSARDSQASILSGFYATHLWPTEAARHKSSSAKPPQTEGTAHTSRPPWGKMLPENLKAAGYATYFAGSWRMPWPVAECGFERSLVLPDPGRSGQESGVLDGRAEEIGTLEGGATGGVAGFAAGFLKEHQEKNASAPFFLMVTLPAPRFSEAPTTERAAAVFKEKFSMGTDALRKLRMERIWKAGALYNADVSAPEAPVREWEALNGKEREALGARMGEHALMLEGLDAGVARITEALGGGKALENTLFVFMGVSVPEGLGLEGASWASSPLRQGGGKLEEGGMGTPLIVHWPAAIRTRGEIREQTVHCVDLTPTLLKAAGVGWPKKSGSIEVPAADGADLSGVWRENRPLVARGVWWERDGSRAFRLGDWKWVCRAGGKGELYHLMADRSERIDLAPANAERVLEMETQWKKTLQRFENDLLRGTAVSAGANPASK